MRFPSVLIAMIALAACGDPLARVERISDVELAEEPVAQALPSEEELAREGGFFSRILRRDPAQAEIDAAVASAGQALTPEAAAAPAGSEPVAADTTDDTSAPGTARTEVSAEAKTAQPERKSGLLGWLRPAKQGPDAPVEAPATEVADADPVAETQKTEADGAASVAAADALVEPAKRRGIFGLGRRAKDETTAGVRTASIAPGAETELPLVQVNPAERGGQQGGAARPSRRGGIDAIDVPFGTVLSYGEVARVCDAERKPLGRKLDKAPARGKGYALYDSNPDSAGPRTFYVTGFSDGCPRQFTAALALFGAPSMHEQLRYGRPGSEYPYSSTDKAYEKVKSSVCGVSKRKPCGSKISQLERSTVFISTYERFSDNARWADILIHDGVVLAAAIKTP